jgi:hypothetical protein
VIKENPFSPAFPVNPKYVVNRTEIIENFDLLLFPFHSLYTFGMFFGDFGVFSKSFIEIKIKSNVVSCESR